MRQTPKRGALASVINTELGERSRRQQVQVFVDQARREIAERKFSDALDDNFTKPRNSIRRNQMCVSC